MASSAFGTASFSSHWTAELAAGRLVLLHPVGLDSATWAGCELADAETPDLPGHGGRPMLGGTLSLALLADWVAGTFEGRLDVVGISVGGAIAQHLALRHPDRVRSLLIACCSGKTPRDALMQRAADTEAHGMEGVTELTLQRWFTAKALEKPEAAFVAYARRRLEADDPAVFAGYWRALAEHDVVERLGELAVKVTVLGGWEDVATPRERLLELGAGISGSRTELLHGPHMFQLERPAEFTAAVRRHLAWVSEPDQPPGGIST